MIDRLGAARTLKGLFEALGCPVVIIWWAVQQAMVLRLCTVYICASWGNAVLCVMAGLVPDSAELIQHGGT